MLLTFDLRKGRTVEITSHQSTIFVNPEKESSVPLKRAQAPSRQHSLKEETTVQSQITRKKRKKKGNSIYFSLSRQNKPKEFSFFFLCVFIDLFFIFTLPVGAWAKLGPSASTCCLCNVQACSTFPASLAQQVLPILSLLLPILPLFYI